MSTKLGGIIKGSNAAHTKQTYMIRLHTGSMTAVCFFETGSSNNSALHRDISSKFGVQIDFDLLKRVPSLSRQGEVDLQRHGRHLEKSA